MVLDTFTIGDFVIPSQDIGIAAVVGYYLFYYL